MLLFRNRHARRPSDTRPRRPSTRRPMAVDIVIPAVGESVTSGVVQRWVKKDGEFVHQDDIVMELETDKVTAELRAPANGTLQTLVKEGETVAVGAVVGRVTEGAAK